MLKRFINYSLLSILLVVLFSTFSLSQRLKVSSQFSIENSKENHNQRQLLKNENRSFLKKMGRANLFSAGYNLSIGAGLFALPSHVTHWERGDFLTTAGPNLKRAWTKEPVWDKDAFLINYVGHPYQGGYYYNNLRSQGAKIWQSSLYCLGQTLLWEFGYEAIKERPSKQDLITTPLGGVLYGELLHRTTLRMRRNGFNTWEKIFVTVFNPAFVLNNGYK